MLQKHVALQKHGSGTVVPRCGVIKRLLFMVAIPLLLLGIARTWSAAAEWVIVVAGMWIGDDLAATAERRWWGRSKPDGPTVGE